MAFMRDLLELWLDDNCYLKNNNFCLFIYIQFYYIIEYTIRKAVARECGKAIDTKMSYPLGLLLIVLIVITMAPALLNM